MDEEQLKVLALSTAVEEFGCEPDDSYLELRPDEVETLCLSFYRKVEEARQRNKLGALAMMYKFGSFAERDTSIPAEKQGLFRKFEVNRVDGSDRPGRKHFGCDYFVIDMDHDVHAPRALREYAEACKDTHPMLSMALFNKFKVA